MQDFKIYIKKNKKTPKHFSFGEPKKKASLFPRKTQVIILGVLQ